MIMVQLWVWFLIAHLDDICIYHWLFALIIDGYSNVLGFGALLVPGVVGGGPVFFVVL